MPSGQVSDQERPSFHESSVGGGQIDLLVGILDLQAVLPGVQRMRSWAREVVAAGPGERALDIGSGTGSEVVAFAARVEPDGEAVGVDPNPAMLAVARNRAEAAGVAAQFVEGTAYHLPFPDASFDAVRCERVYQHLDDPAAATAEIARVLRPGGRVVLIDSDWSTAITHPGDAEVIRTMNEAALHHLPNPNSGRRLRGLLAGAGFDIDDIGSEAVIWDPVASQPLFEQMRRQAVADGVITEEQHDALVAAMEAGIAAGDHHLSVTMFAVLAHKK